MFYFLGPYVILEVYGHKELPNIKLENIPKKLNLHFLRKIIILLALSTLRFLENKPGQMKLDITQLFVTEIITNG